MSLRGAGTILEMVVEYELIDRNPAKGGRRRLATTKPNRPWLDRAEQIIALLDGARRLDREAQFRPGQRRALLATLVFRPTVGRELIVRTQCCTSIGLIALIVSPARSLVCLAIRWSIRSQRRSSLCQHTVSSVGSLSSSPVRWEPGSAPTVFAPMSSSLRRDSLSTRSSG